MKKSFFNKFLRWLCYFIPAHKIASALAVTVLAAGGYWIFKTFNVSATESRYVLGTVDKAAVIATVTGSGQVSASSQIDLKPKVSGEVLYVGVANGQEVKAGTLIADIDSQDAEKAVRDAEANLASARLSLEKLLEPPDALAAIQTENSLAKANESKLNAESDLKKAYDDSFNAVANAFLDLPTVMAGLQDTFYSASASPQSAQSNIDYYANAVSNYDDRVFIYRDDARAKYQAARTQYDKNFSDYKSASRFSDTPAVESLAAETYETTKIVADAVKSGSNLIQFYEDKLTERNLKPIGLADTHLASLASFTGKTNNHLANLLNAETAVKNGRDSIVNAGRAIAESAASLAKLKAGASALDIESSELAVTQRENALLDAREKLADYAVRAPFDGMVAKLDVKKSDSVTNGAVVATLITKQKIAGISLNEVDVSKIKVGEKATLTFDAVEGLSISGSVAEVDAVGAVTQGVVTYNIKIGFDTEDDRVKPGMSVSAAIITDVRQDVLIVPNGAIKSQGGTRYVEMFSVALPDSEGGQGVPSSAPPYRQPVEIGLFNDTLTEIVSGLKEGDKIVVRTVNSQTANQASQQAPSLFGAPGGNRGGGALRGAGGAGR